MIAIGFLHQARSAQTYTPSGGLNHLALSHYSQAVIELRSRIENARNGPGVDVVLLACLLFVGFEMLQHDIPVAMDHLRFGLGLISGQYKNAARSESSHNIATVFRCRPEEAIDELVPIFVRLDYVSSNADRLSKVSF